MPIAIVDGKSGFGGAIYCFIPCTVATLTTVYRLTQYEGYKGMTQLRKDGWPTANQVKTKGHEQIVGEYSIRMFWSKDRSAYCVDARYWSDLRGRWSTPFAWAFVPTYAKALRQFHRYIAQAK